ncbi:Rpn family recombination-promoting nuclease/putative transposase [uncultured Aliivibrio sp.]|uniref:Rpn family recombination-promoting nuclease/putative transposase n=1 Tax=uncultured Aliivibrio sp. TaxID=873085 RepID=UPI00260CA9DE|nr:Rpn family recombination-promoting nuclease/putative transposase [uncultured Aliivibrio sp.]
MSKKNTTTPHDGLFKAFLTTPDTAKDMLEIHLPTHLKTLCDLSTLKLESGSFLEDDLRPYYSDVLYSMKTECGDGYIYALIEHQSSPDEHMAFRMFRYAIAAMQKHLDAGNKDLPLVVPLLFYHGKTSPYPYSMNWLDCFTKPEMAKALYNNDFPLVDVTVMDDSEIMQHKRIALLELVQKHIYQKDINDILESLAILLLNDYHTDSQVRTLIEYLVTVGETQNVNTLLEELAQQVPKHEGTLMTIAEQLILQGEQKGLQQGLQQGRQEGEQKGRQDTLKEMARNLLLSGVDKDAIMKATGFSSRELELISH